jgi:hypothetical protein
MKLATANKLPIADCRLPIGCGHGHGVRPKFFSIGNRKSAIENAFTLAEVLAALLFLALVIPAAVEVLHIASLSGEVAARKTEAARVADRLLNESIVTTNWMSARSGTVTEGTLDFRWTLSSQVWQQDPIAQMQLLTAEVKYSAQGRDFSVKLSTLANPQSQSLTTTGPQF